MKILSFIDEITRRHYPQFDEERKRNLTIGVILNFMMIFVMGSWVIGFWILGMKEMFWLDVMIWIGYVAILVGIIRYGMRFTIARFLILALGCVITGVPPIFYGIDTIVTLHLVFVPLATILLFSRKEKKQFLQYIGGIIIFFVSVIAWGLTYGPTHVVPPDTFRVFNLIVAMDSMFISLYLAYFFFSENTQYKELLANEREKSDHLLLSIFPETIADQLRNSNQSVADSFDNVTILFADIVGFTKYASRMGPSELVAMLDEVFSEFDAVVDKYGIEKIKTIGDAYMAVGGLPIPDSRHCHNVASMALEINQVIKDKFYGKYDLQIRIGIHTGKAVAGVIGNKKFSYDLWGDSVNIASRFEASGIPGKIHISQDVKDMIEGEFLIEDQGEINIKGKGMMRSYFLEGKKDKDAHVQSSISTISGSNISEDILPYIVVA